MGITLSCCRNKQQPGLLQSVAGMVVEEDDAENPYSLGKMRLVCLHGMGGNRDVMELQCSALGLGEEVGIELIFIEGSVEAEAWHGSGGEGYYQWFEDGGGATPREASKRVLQAICAHRPVDGIVGFSQGAAVATDIIAGIASMEPAHRASLPRFVISLHGACPSAIATAASQAEADHRPRTYPLSIPSFHLIGTSDPHKQAAYDILPYYTSPETFEHDSGHEIDVSDVGEVRGKLLRFLRNQKKKNEVK